MVTEYQRPVKGRLRTNATRYSAQQNPLITTTAGWIYPAQRAAETEYQRPVKGRLHSKTTSTLIFLLYICFLTGCRNDIFGLFGSTDLDNRLKEKNSFKFLTPASRELLLGDEYSFIVINDTHIEDGNAHGLEQLKDEIDDEIKFVVFNGDITQCGYRQDIEKFIEIADSLGVPCYPVIGNHDVFFGNWPEWKDLIGSTRYRINGDSATLFILDSANAYFGKDQLDWLESEIKNANDRVFVFSHVNLFEISPVHLQQFTDTRERARFMSILKDRCDIMFMGHLHHRLLTEAGCVQYISIEDYRDNRSYCRVSVKKTGISWEFKTL
jgi:predicted phosphodiesterase